MKITDLSIKALKAPVSGAIIHYDDNVPGFGVRVSEGGTKSFILTHGRLRKRETIGRVGVVPLQDARRAAKERLAAYTLGKADITSVAWVLAVQEFLGECTKRLKPRTVMDRKIASHATYEDAETLAAYSGLSRGTNEFNDYVSRGMK